MINVQESVLAHKNLRYTTDIGTLSLILTNKTFRCTCLASGKLNDAKEKERNGIDSYAETKYIVCFSYDEHESVPFWFMYGGKRSEKVQLCFKNFLSNPSLFFNDEIAITESGQLFIGEKRYQEKMFNDGKSVEIDGFVGDAYIEKVEAFDVNYLPSDDDTFSKSYLNKVDLSCIGCGKQMVAFPDCLGKHKSNPWEYEKETRILCTTGLFDHNYMWDWIDLYLKDEIFRDLEIIMSPWDTGIQKRQITKLIMLSNLDEEIRNSIVIHDSELKGTINLP